MGGVLCHILAGIAVGNRPLLNGGFGHASFPPLFLSLSVWVQSTGAFCELVRLVCQESEFRRVISTRNCV